MPLGNLTSQFFANIYLNELDQFVKHKFKAKYYLRYVDDFIILHENKEALEYYKERIDKFLGTIRLELHQDKSKIFPLYKGINLLGFRVFYYHKLLRKRNIKKFERKLKGFKEEYDAGMLDYDTTFNSLQGWLAYAAHGNTYKLRMKFIKKFESLFPNEIADTEINQWLKINHLPKCL